MVKLKEKTIKQYNRDYYERHPELKEKRKERYWEEKKKRVTVINVDNLVINAKNVTVVEEE